jgi:uncharacterized damage-inducible protein DinB
MDTKDVRVLYEYNAWANARSLADVGRVTAEEFTRESGGSFASLRDTLVHMMWAEWIWLRRWLGESPRAQFDPAEFPDLDSARARWAEIERVRAEFIEGLTDEALRRTLTYTNTRGEEWSYTLAEMMLHTANHSTYHRGQLTTLLRQLGREPASTDFLYYIDDLPPGAQAR